ncbi:glutathionylspermidine synthase family protein [Lysinibacillus sp. BW-2-10]|uniref:glutathionylspermidine synthase family protein n=1 Tax=Lysinibacillus sp. BW-2-10 TaxID=2590030 RepID=UPI001180EB8A|nr:glutathionylspermidine synthase family protein [Lysinibacillus sp. BW-2-10]TSI05745.1 glutathionylspermidine synthase family protein [Lysinibacillus sp. BW-2-10]
MTSKHTYNINRKAFYSQFNQFFADFADLEYALYDVMMMKKEKIDEIQYATNILWKVFSKVGKQFKKLKKEQLLALGIREEMIPYLHLDYLPQQSILARFDFICTEIGDIKLIELNGDTPFLIQETFEMNRALCNQFNFCNPNEESVIIKSLSSALFSAMTYLKLKETPVVVITGKEETEDLEEYCQVQYLKRILPFEIKYVPISQLIIYPTDNEHIKRGLYTPSMEKIHILFRPAHPIEFLIDDVAEDGDQIGLHLLDLVKDQQLAIINSPAAYILQSKILLWLIWEKRNNPLLFTKEERETINKYMLPTYMSADSFLQSEQPFVKKPVFSREGNTIEIYNSEGEKINTSQHQHYTDNLYIYQQYVEMPSITIQLKDSQHEKKWLIGSFIADDQACGIACRVGNQITEWDSHWLAIGSPVSDAN